MAPRSVRVLCEAADCGALLEVELPPSLACSSAAGTTVIVQCGACQQFLQVQVPAVTPHQTTVLDTLSESPWSSQTAAAHGPGSQRTSFCPPQRVAAPDSLRTAHSAQQPHAALPLGPWPDCSTDHSAAPAPSTTTSDRQQRTGSGQAAREHSSPAAGLQAWAPVGHGCTPESLPFYAQDSWHMNGNIHDFDRLDDDGLLDWLLSVPDLTSVHSSSMGGTSPCTADDEAKRTASRGLTGGDDHLADALMGDAQDDVGGLLLQLWSSWSKPETGRAQSPETHQPMRRTKQSHRPPPKPRNRRGITALKPTVSLNPYSEFVRREMRRLRAVDPMLDHRVALRIAAGSWAGSKPSLAELKASLPELSRPQLSLQAELELTGAAVQPHSFSTVGTCADGQASRFSHDGGHLSGWTAAALIPRIPPWAQCSVPSVAPATSTLQPAPSCCGPPAGTPGPCAHCAQLETFTQGSSSASSLSSLATTLELRVLPSLMVHPASSLV